MINLSLLDYYVICVGSHDAAGTTWTSPVTASTSLAAPAGLVATGESPYVVNLKWQGVLPRPATRSKSLAMAHPGPSGPMYVSAVSLGVSTLSFNSTGTHSASLPGMTTWLRRGRHWQRPPRFLRRPPSPLAVASATEIDLKWNAMPGATSYTVDQNGLPIKTLSGNASTSTGHRLGLAPPTVNVIASMRRVVSSLQL